MEKIQALRDEFATLHKEAGEIIAKGTEATADEAKANETRFSRMDTIKSVLDADSKLAKYAFTTNTNVVKPVDVMNFADNAVIKVHDAKFDRKEFGKNAMEWLKGRNYSEQFATQTSATQSGIYLPVEVAQPITPTAINSFRAGYAAWGLDVMQTPGTETLNIPVLDASAGGVVAENASSETENEPTLTKSIVSTVKTYQSGSEYFSNQVLNATSFDLISASLPTLYYSKELGLESAMTAAMIADGNITQTVATSTVSGFTFANLASLDNALPKKYNQLKVYVLSATAYAAAEGLSNSQGAPIMVPDPQNGNLKRIFGNPVFRNDYLQSLAANHIVGFCFSLMGFHLRDAGQPQVQRYTQVPAKPNQTGINWFAYHAYGYAPDAVAALVCPAS